MGCILESCQGDLPTTCWLESYFSPFFLFVVVVKKLDFSSMGLFGEINCEVVAPMSRLFDHK
mgnify:CR=1 FL=1